jgi:hypothetical protein
VDKHHQRVGHTAREELEIMGNPIPAMIPGEFEEGLLSFPSLAEASRDPLYVDKGFILDELSEQAPWKMSLLYGDGGALSLPLELMFYESLKGATATVFRRHKASGRIIPCQISQDDPGLRDKSLKDLPWQDVLRRVVPPRFDPVLTPAIMAALNQDQMISMALGVLHVLQLQLANPVLFGWAPGATVDAGSAALLRTLARRSAVVSVDAAGLSARVGSEVAQIPVVNSLQKFLEAARRISLMGGVPPNVKADAIEALADRFGLEMGGRAAMPGGRIIIVAKDAKTALQIAADGGVSFGRVQIVNGTLDIVNPAAIRVLKP